MVHTMCQNGFFLKFLLIPLVTQSLQISARVEPLPSGAECVAWKHFLNEVEIRYTLENFGSIFDSHVESANATFRRHFKECLEKTESPSIVGSSCTDLVKALNALTNKANLDLGAFATRLRSMKIPKPNYSRVMAHEVVGLEKLLNRVNYIHAEFSTEIDGPEICVNNLRKKLQQLMKNVNKMILKIKDHIRRSIVDQVIIYVKGASHILDEIRNAFSHLSIVERNKTINESVEMALPTIEEGNSLNYSYFESILEFGKDYDHTSTNFLSRVIYSITERVLSKPEPSNQYLMRIAHEAARIPNAQLQEKFPKSFQYLFWGKQLCVQNSIDGFYLVNQSILTEKSQVSFTENVVGVHLEAVKHNRSKEFCRWETYSTVRGYPKSVTFIFQFRVDMNQRNSWGLTVKDEKLILNDNGNDQFWTLQPDPTYETFFLRHSEYKDLDDAVTTSVCTKENNGIHMVFLTSEGNSANCFWTINSSEIYV